MRDKLDKLAQIATVLNNERNQLNEQLEIYEKALNDLNIGIRCQISIGSEPDVKRQFKYDKVKGKWGLYVSENEFVWEITRAPGYLRI